MSFTPGSGNTNIAQIAGANPAANNPLPVRVSNGSAFVDPTQIRAITPTDVITARLSDAAGSSITLGQKTSANSLPVVLASDQSAIPVSQNGTWNITNVTGTVSLPTGAATAALQTAGNASLATIASQVGMTIKGFANINYGSTSVTTSAYVTLTNGINAAISHIEIYDSSTQALILALGAAGSEQDTIMVTPGGNGLVPCAIPANTRVSLKALNTNATTGIGIFNFYG